MINEEQAKLSHIDPLLNKDRFKNRRKMAWYCLYSLLGSFFLILGFVAFDVIRSEEIDNFAPLFAWFYGATSSVVLGYMGSTTFVYNKFMDAVKKNGNKG